MQEPKNPDEILVLGDSPVKRAGSKKLKQASLLSFASKTPTTPTAKSLGAPTKGNVDETTPAKVTQSPAASKTEEKTPSRKPPRSKKKSVENEAKKLKLDKPIDLISDEEVTSSDQNTESKVETKVNGKAGCSLDKFVKRENMQHDEVSTSNPKDAPESFSLVVDELTQNSVISDKLPLEKAEDDHSLECVPASPESLKKEIDSEVKVENTPVSTKAGEKSGLSTASTPESDVSSEDVTMSLAVTPNTSVSSVKTPKSRKSGGLVDTASTPISSKKLTPKQLERKAEMERKREEREKLKLEKEQQKAAEKAEKERLKKEKQEEKEKQKQAELDAKEKKKEEERLRKEEEKLKKEEEIRKKEEAKKKKEEEKIQQEEQEKLKKEKAKLAFQSFFTKRKSDAAVPSKEAEEVEGAERFKPFRVKENMRLAPLVRSDFDESRKGNFDALFGGRVHAEDLYLKELKKGKAGGGRCGKIVWPVEKKDEDIEVLEDESGEVDSSANNSGEVIMVRDSLAKKKLHWKLLQFRENRRPAYWGTWTKSSSSVGPRRPFGKDQHYFDYDVDSDDEWEEEEPGESLSDSEGEQEPADEYEVDNELFVPHGYLSDEEAEDEMEDMSPEARKEKLKMKEEDFEKELKKNPKTLKPVLFGCMWEVEDDSSPSYCHLQKVLGIYRAVSLFPLPICTSFGGVQPTPTDRGSLEEGDGEVPADIKAKRKEMPEEDLIQLIKMIHGSRIKKDFIIKKFLEYWDTKYEGKKDSLAPPSKFKLVNKFKQIATYGKCAETNLGAWLVHSDVITKYNVQDLPEFSKAAENSEEVAATPARKSLITKYTQVMTPDELKQQQQKRVQLLTLPSKPAQALSENSGAVEKKGRPAEGNGGEEPPTKKRVAFVTLSSPQKRKTPSAALMDRFLNKAKDTSGSEQDKEEEKKEDVECICID